MITSIMINFNFNLDETDAENLCSMINNDIVNTISRSLDFINDKTRYTWYKAHIKYLKELQKTVELGMKKAP
jgi:hypothetical protein